MPVSVTSCPFNFTLLSVQPCGSPITRNVRVPVSPFISNVSSAFTVAAPPPIESPSPLSTGMAMIRTVPPPVGFMPPS